MELNISSTSNAGKKIIEQYRNWGSLKQTNLTNKHDAREDKIDLDRNIADIVALVATGGTKEQINQKFSKSVILATHATWDLGNDEFRVGLEDGYGGGFSKVIELLLEEHPEKFKTRADLDEFLKGLKIVDPNSDTLYSKDPKAELLSVKHLPRVDEAWEKHAGFLKAKGDKQKEVVTANANLMDIEIRDGHQKYLTGDPDNNVPAGVVDTEYSNKLIKKIYDYQDVSTDRKNDLIEEILGYNAGDLGGFRNVTIALQALDSGNMKTYYIARDKMNKKERREFETKNDTELADLHAHFPGPIDDFVGEVITQHGNKGSTVGKGTNETHPTAEAVYKSRIYFHYKDAVKNGIDKNDIKARIQYAREKSDEELDNAVEVKVEVDQFGRTVYVLPKNAPQGAKLNNPYNWIEPEPGYDVSGRYYVNAFGDSDILLKKRQDAAKLDLKKQPENKTALRGETIVDSTADKDVVLQHSRFATSDEHKKIINWAEGIVNKDNLGKGETVLDYMPKNLKIWADHHNIPYTDAVNMYLSKAQGKNWGLRVSLDATDVARIKRIDSDKPWTPDNTQVVVPKTYADFFGFNAFYAAQANGVLPMSKEVRKFFENEGDSDLMTAFSASNELDVSKWTDEKGKTQTNIAKYEDFYKKGGHQYFTWEDVESLMPSETNLAWKDDIGWYNPNKFTYRPLPVADETVQQNRLKKKRKKNPNLYGDTPPPIDRKTLQKAAIQGSLHGFGGKKK